MKSSLNNSYRYCEQLVRHSGSNFVIAFRTLPREMYQQMCVLYAFMRYTDDLGDRPGALQPIRTELLTRWRSELTSALAGEVSPNLILPALADVTRKCEIPIHYLTEVINGVEGDLTPRTFQTFSQLEHYCYQVAGVVGLCCLRIWGARGEDSVQTAIACGTAFQLTNILRDIKEDAELGRIYLPVTELEACGYSPEELSQGINNAAFQQLMKLQVERAWSYYRQAYPLQDQLLPAGRRLFLAFFDLYSSLLREIERADYDVLSRRIRLSRWKKASVAMRCLLRMSTPRQQDFFHSQMTGTTVNITTKGS